MTIAYPSTRRPYLLDISASNSNSQTFTVNWNVLEFDNPKNQEGHCPVEYYKQHLSYVRMATHDMKFRSLRDYPDQLRLVSLGDMPSTHNILTCGKISNKKGYGTCHKHRLCTYCAWLKGNDMWKRMTGLFPRASWSFLTISFREFTAFDGTDHNTWLLRWDASVSAIQRLVGLGRIPGAIVREEMSVNSYEGREVNPHLHAILSCQQLDSDTVNLLKAFIRGYRDDSGFGVEAELSIESANITTEEELKRKVFYFTKETDLVTPYRSFGNIHEDCEFGVVNKQCREFQESYLTGIFQHRQTHYLGNLDKRKKGLYLANHYGHGFN